MSINVPGYGAVPVIWRPAVLGADASYGRDGKRVLAIVHHRMVGTLPGTISTFTQGTRNRPVSTTFGVGFLSGKLTIAQFVDLRDTAFGNGNYDPSGRWDDAGYPLTQINARTVSIEHEDGATRGRGIVKEPVIAASIELDRVLLSGDLDRIRNAGIRATGAGGAAAVGDLGDIVPGPKTIVDHNFIAGRLKPYCWQRWLDGAGFPQARYLASLKETADMPGLATHPRYPMVAGVARIPAGTELINVETRERPRIQGDGTRHAVGIFVRDYGSEDGYLVEYGGATHWVDKDNVEFTAYEAAPPADPGSIEAAVLEGRRIEWDRQKAEAGATLSLAPRP